VSVTEFSTRAAWMVGLAIAAAVFAGRRKTARAMRREPRRRAPEVMPFEEMPTTLYRRPNPLRKVASAGGLGVIGIVSGAVFAIVVSVAAFWFVSQLSGVLD
jgi:hypothetical protein